MDKNYKLKTGKVEEKVVGAYKKIEDGVVGGYQAVEDAVVGTYKKSRISLLRSIWTSKRMIQNHCCPV